LRPDVRETFCLLLVAQQLGFVIGVREVLDLQPLVFVEGRQQETKLFLKIVQIGNRAVRQIGSFENKSLRHISTAPQRIEQQKIADEETIRRTLEHIQ